MFNKLVDFRKGLEPGASLLNTTDKVFCVFPIQALQSVHNELFKIFILNKKSCLKSKKSQNNNI